MFEKVLIANRGEIALRVIRALREMGIRSVAVYSTADADALHVKFADEAVCIGPPPVAPELPEHPGHHQRRRDHRRRRGPSRLRLSVRERRVRRGVREVRHARGSGPSPTLMRLMGDKISARAAMSKAGVPILPGSGTIEKESELIAAAERIGFPIILKAAAGGGGRGMKIVYEGKQLAGAWNTGRAEAQAAFGNPDMYMERYCERPRHIEVQVIGDSHGHAAHLGERECSIQRRHQKIIEEAPSAALDEAHARQAPGRGGQGDRGDRLPQPRHARVPARRGRPLLLHGDEHAHPGRAPGHRDGHRPGPGARADAASPPASSYRSRRPGGRAATPSSCASTPRTRRPSRPARDRITASQPAGRAGRAGRHPHLRGVRGAAALRLAAGQAHRPRRQPAGRHQPRAALPGRVRRRGCSRPTSPSIGAS